jgi:hypothetical protein
LLFNREGKGEGESEREREADGEKVRISDWVGLRVAEREREAEGGNVRYGDWVGLELRERDEMELVRVSETELEYMQEVGNLNSVQEYIHNSQV